MKARAAADGALHPDTAPMRFDDGPADRKAEAHAVGLCRLERREELLPDLVGDAGAGIRYGHLDQPVRAQPGRHLEVANRTLRHRLDGIAHQVDQHLLGDGKVKLVDGGYVVGCGRVIAIDAVETKLTLAQEFGATDVIDASGGGVVQKIRDLTGGGVDYSFEAIGLKETAEQAFDMLRNGGTATIIGMIPQGTKIELDGPSFLREKRIQGSSMGSNRFRVDMPRYIEFYLQGRLKLEEMVTKRIKLDQINAAFEDIQQVNVARSVITFN